MNHLMNAATTAAELASAHTWVLWLAAGVAAGRTKTTVGSVLAAVIVVLAAAATFTDTATTATLIAGAAATIAVAGVLTSVRAAVRTVRIPRQLERRPLAGTKFRSFSRHIPWEMTAEEKLNSIQQRLTRTVVANTLTNR